PIGIRPARTRKTGDCRGLAPAFPPETARDPPRSRGDFARKIGPALPTQQAPPSYSERTPLKTFAPDQRCNVFHRRELRFSFCGGKRRNCEESRDVPLPERVELRLTASTAPSSSASSPLEIPRWHP